MDADLEWNKWRRGLLSRVLFTVGAAFIAGVCVGVLWERWQVFQAGLG
jgi:hypothetical protein